ncbi:MAG: ABC transporter substrate-binding protein, partial [Planktomarina sp.]
MLKRLFATLLLLVPGTVFAQACDDLTHKVQPGETIFTIAEKYYGSAERWSLIFYGNQRILSGSVFEVAVGTDLNVPCLPGQIVPDARPLEQDNAEMKLVTGSNYAPFTDRDWPGEGMITELVNAAMEATTDPVSYSITWENDWSKHLFPMLDSKKFDMGFPWYRPNCDETPDHDRCANFHFSDPIVELLGLLFVKNGSDFTFDQDSDAFGKTLCRPAGYFVFDIDR